MTIPWLADALRAANVTVIEHSGWKTHDRPGSWDPRFLVVHATAAPRSQSDAAQVAIVRDGRSDLNGPIANACIDRQGRWHVLSAGRCNTTLTGTAGPFDGLGNTNALGIEACNDNGLASPAETWPDVQYRSYVVGVAAICKRMGWTAARAVGHKEHTPGRKTDPTFSMTTFRAAVTAAIAGDLEDDMPTVSEIWAAEFGPDNNRKTAGQLLAEARSAAIAAQAAGDAAKLRDEAILKAAIGADDGAAVIARIDAFETRQRTILAEIPGAVVAQLPDEVGGASFTDVQKAELHAAVTRALAALRLSVEPAEETGAQDAAAGA